MTAPAPVPVTNQLYPFGMMPPETGATEEFGRREAVGLPAVPTPSLPAIPAVAPASPPAGGPPTPVPPAAAYTPYFTTEVVNTTPSPAAYDTHLSTSPATPVLIFITLLIIGAASLLLTRVKKTNQIIAVLFFAFMTSMVPIGVNLVTKEASLESQAGVTYTPKNIKVTNVSTDSFTVMWETDNPNVGAVRVRETRELNPLTRIISEPSSQGIYQHVVLITGLKTNTLYYFEVLSSGTWYDSQGQPLTISTK